MNDGARSINPFRVLQTHRNFRLFWIGQTLSLIGSWMQTMALGWLALELSNSALVVGLVASVGAIPIVLFSLHAGVFVDRSDRLRLVRITQSVFLAEAVVLWAVTLFGVVNIPLLLLMAVIQGCCSAVEIPARQSMIIQLVGRADLQPAIALNSSGFNLARIIGPAIGGVVIHQFGIGWCFGLNAVSYLAVLWGVMLIKLPNLPNAIERSVRVTPFSETAIGGETPTSDVPSGSLSRALDGIRELLQQNAVRDVLALVTVGAVVAGPFLTLMPVMARDRLHLGADGYGGLLTSVGIGGLIGALAIAGPVSHWPRGRTLTVTSIAFPVLLLAFACTTNAWAANTLLVMTGVSMIIFNALANGMLQTLVDEAYRGRLMALYSLLYVGLSQAVGALLVGGLARVVGVAWAIGGSAIVTLSFAVWTARRSTIREIL